MMKDYRQLLRLWKQGASTSSMADALGVKRDTVRDALTRIVKAYGSLDSVPAEASDEEIQERIRSSKDRAACCFMPVDCDDVLGKMRNGDTCARMFVAAGVKKENITMLDSRGVIYSGREGLTAEKQEFASDTEKRTLSEAIAGADVFMGLSVKGVLTKEMLRSMSRDPIVFAMANPDPEITPEEALSARDDVIMATGRSDYPNQINNVLGFPFIFRGALDVRATRITEGMKMAASRALAELAREGVPAEVKRAYGGKDFSFGREYIVPKPFDPRVIEYEAVAVAKAAVEDGVARFPISDWDAYRESLKKRMEHYWK